MKKNNFESTIQEKLDEQLDSSHDIQIEVKSNHLGDYDCMRFIKHPTFDFADNLNSPPSIKDNKTKKNIISAFYVEGGMPIINPEREFIKYQKPLP